MDETTQRRVAPAFHRNRRTHRRGPDHRSAPRARPRLHAAQRPAQHRRRRRRRHGPHQPHQPRAARTSSRSATWTGATRQGVASTHRRSSSQARQTAPQTNRRRRARGKSSRASIGAQRQSSDRAAEALIAEQLPKAKRYTDYREMLEQAEGHRRGRRRHARSHARDDRDGGDGSRQARLRAEAAVLVGGGSARAGEEGEGDTKVATQMGNQGHSSDDARTAVTSTSSGGAIGDVSEVHVWTNRPLAYWPQGIPRPGRCATPPSGSCRWNSRGVDARLAARDGRRTTRCPTSWRGICSSAPRRTSTTTRSITRSTGAAGSTGAAARSATWART